MPLNLPNVLTWLRIIAIPLLVVLFYLPDAWVRPHDKNLYACVLFTAAAITDWLDGYLARRLNQSSAFVAFLDPVADKLIVLCRRWRNRQSELAAGTIDERRCGR